MWPGENIFFTEEQVKEEVKNWSVEVTAEFYGRCTRKSVPRLTTCVEKDGETTWKNRSLTYSNVNNV